MIAVDLAAVLAESASEVLETMYFIGVTGYDPVEPSIADEWICVRLDFRGSRSGSLGVRAPLRTARTLAESFLGTEPETISEWNCSEVLGEMANMICGAVLNRLANEEQFELSHPEAEYPEWTESWRSHTVSTMFRLEEGALAMWLDWETG
jgi:CheY-specific phosphatase CheX